MHLIVKGQSQTFEDILLSTTTLLHTSHTITQSPNLGKYNIGTICPLLTELGLQTIDPPTKLHVLDSSRSLFLVFGVYAAFNYHTVLNVDIHAMAQRISDTTYL